MKTILALILMLVIAFALFGCSRSKGNPVSPNPGYDKHYYACPYVNTVSGRDCTDCHD